SGQASLGGTLSVSLVNGFGPSGPQQFQVLMAQGGISGSFATTSLPSFDNQPAFTVQTTQGPPGSLSLVAGISSADLAVAGTSITVNNVSPASTTGMTGHSITVGYTVENLSSSAARGSWTDSVYLSAHAMLDAGASLLGRVTHTGGLAGQSRYSGT